jgi:hypothetical protein
MHWSTLGRLEAMAGGKADGGSWKEKLNRDSAWEDIEREASYHLVQKDGTRLPHTLSKLHRDMQTNKEAYVQVCTDLADSRVTSHGEEESTPKTLLHRIAAADMKAAVTHTESTFFCSRSWQAREQIAHAGFRPGLKACQIKLITSEELIEGMWRKVMVLAAPRRRPTPATPTTPTSSKEAAQYSGSKPAP